ncbi:MAG: hypothetical protein LBD33_00250 [Puniceicoccales bacterium]|nr:hypothetical protein [Puniceicoccales bacterium]
MPTSEIALTGESRLCAREVKQVPCGSIGKSEQAMQLELMMTGACDSFFGNNQPPGRPTGDPSNLHGKTLVDLRKPRAADSICDASAKNSAGGCRVKKKHRVAVYVGEKGQYKSQHD